MLLEPGVGFYDLYDYLQTRNIPLWMSVPGNSWGSVIGNALDRGLGYTPYGEHTRNFCGMEVVLPDGDMVRTGMGAMPNAPTWQLHKYGYGPAWDQLFVQSNFGIVTKAGMWLMPQPRGRARLRCRDGSHGGLRSADRRHRSAAPRRGPAAVPDHRQLVPRRQYPHHAQAVDRQTRILVG